MAPVHNISFRAQPDQTFLALAKSKAAMAMSMTTGQVRDTKRCLKRKVILKPQEEDLFFNQE